MSDTAQGPGWWQASDGRWYPPQAPPGSTPSHDDVLPAGPPLGSSVSTSGKATATLVLGILSFVTCPILAVAALIVGSQADREIRDSYGRVGGEGVVKAGRILAIIDLVLVVPLVLFAIAVPTFLGARERAQDRTAQSELRNAFTAEKVFYTDERQWTDDPTVLASIEPSLHYEQGLTPVADGTIYVAVDDQILGLSNRSASGTCFYVFQQGADAAPGYGEDETCGPIQDQPFNSAWE